MKLSHFFLVRKIAFVSFFSFLVCNTQAQVTVPLNTEVEPGSYGSPSITSGTTDACLDNDGSPESATFTLSSTGLDNLTYSWSVKGGIDLTSGATGASATVEPIIDADGRYNKGRLTVFYNGTIDSTYDVVVSCGGEPEEKEVEVQVPKSGVAYVDLYQKFTLTDSIVGDECVVENQREAYSIKDLVSGNLLEGIGIDEYFWDHSEIVPGFANGEYASGDSSAITIKFISPLGNIAGKELKVRVGKCNTGDPYMVKVFKAALGKQTITPSIFGCIPSSETELELEHPGATGITYTWILPPATGYTFAGGNTESSNPVTININDNAGYVLLKSDAGPSSDFCTEEPRVDTFYVQRSLDTSSTITGPTCVTQPGTYTYSVSPNPGAAVVWDFPTGWEIVGGSANENASTVQVNVTGSAISDTVWVSTLACGGGSISLPLNLRPGTLGIISQSDTCITPGSSATIDFQVSAVDNAEYYAWTLPVGWTFDSGENTNSITVIPDGNHVGTVSVTAHSYCAESNTAETDVFFGPVQPDTILVSQSCINKGTTDQVTFSVTDIPGESYEWIVPSGFGTIQGADDGNSIVVNTKADASGSYLIQVRAANDCGKSAYTELEVDVAGIGSVSIFVTPIMDGGTQVGEFLLASVFPSGSYNYQWYDEYDNDLGTTNTLYLSGSYSTTVRVEVSDATCTTVKTHDTDFGLYNAKVANPANSASLKVYPKPASDELTVRVSGKYSSGSYELISMEGSRILSGELSGHSTTLNTTSLVNGKYILVVTLDGQVSAETIMIQK